MLEESPYFILPFMITCVYIFSCTMFMLDGKFSNKSLDFRIYRYLSICFFPSLIMILWLFNARSTFHETKTELKLLVIDNKLVIKDGDTIIPYYELKIPRQLSPGDIVVKKVITANAYGLTAAQGTFYTLKEKE